MFARFQKTARLLNRGQWTENHEREFGPLPQQSDDTIG